MSIPKWGLARISWVVICLMKYCWADSYTFWGSKTSRYTFIFWAHMGKSSYWYGNNVVCEQLYYPLPHNLYQNDTCNRDRYASSMGTSVPVAYLACQSQCNGSRWGICTNVAVLAEPRMALTRKSNVGGVLYDCNKHLLRFSMARRTGKRRIDDALQERHGYHDTAQVLIRLVCGHWLRCIVCSG